MDDTNSTTNNVMKNSSNSSQSNNTETSLYKPHRRNTYFDKDVEYEYNLLNDCRQPVGSSSAYTVPGWKQHPYIDPFCIIKQTQFPNTWQTKCKATGVDMHRFGIKDPLYYANFSSYNGEGVCNWYCNCANQMNTCINGQCVRDVCQPNPNNGLVYGTIENNNHCINIGNGINVVDKTNQPCTVFVYDKQVGQLHTNDETGYCLHSTGEEPVTWSPCKNSGTRGWNICGETPDTYKKLMKNNLPYMDGSIASGGKLQLFSDIDNRTQDHYTFNPGY